MVDETQRFEFVVRGFDHTGSEVNCHTSSEDHLHALHTFLRYRQTDPTWHPRVPVTTIEEHYQNSDRWNLTVDRSDGAVKYYEVK